MATIAKLKIDLIADTQKFAAGMAKAKAVSTGFGRSVAATDAITRKFAGTLLRVGSIATGLTFAAAGAGLSVLVTQQFAAIDATAKFADVIGIGTHELTGLHHAAELTGVGTRTLDMGLQRMTRRIAEAANGTGEARAALLELNLDARKLAAAGPYRAFRQIADVMQTIPNQTDRVRLAFKLFDSEGVRLVNTLALGSEGLREVDREAAKLGLTVSRTDARRIEEMNDSITRVRAAFTGTARILAVALAPEVERVAADFNEWAQANGGLAPKLERTTRSAAGYVRTAAEFVKENRGAIIVVAKLAVGVVALSLAFSVLARVIVVARSAMLIFFAAAVITRVGMVLLRVAVIRTTAAFVAMSAAKGVLFALKFGLLAVAAVAVKVAAVIAAVVVVGAALTAAVIATNRSVREGVNWFEAYGDAAYSMAGGLVKTGLALTGLDIALLGASKAAMDYQEMLSNLDRSGRFVRQNLQAQAEAATAANKPLGEQILLREQVIDKLAKEVEMQRQLRDAAPIGDQKESAQRRLNSLNAMLNETKFEVAAMEDLDLIRPDQSGAVEETVKVLDDLRKKIDALQGRRIDLPHVSLAMPSGASEQEIAEIERYAQHYNKLEGARLGAKSVRELEREIHRYGMTAAEIAEADALENFATPEDARRVGELTEQFVKLRQSADISDRIAAAKREIFALTHGDIAAQVAVAVDDGASSEQAAELRDELMRLKRTRITTGIGDELKSARRDLEAFRYGEIKVKLDELKRAGATMQELQDAKDKLTEATTYKFKLEMEQQERDMLRQLAEMDGRGIEFRLEELRLQGLDQTQLDEARRKLEHLAELQRQVDQKQITINVEHNLDDLRIELEHFGKHRAEIQYQKDIANGVDPQLAGQRRDAALELDRKQAAADIVDRNKTAAERAQEELDKARDLNARGLLDDDQFVREQRRISGELNGDEAEEESIDRRSASLIDLSTGAGQAQLARMQQQRAGATVEEKLLAEQRGGNRLLERIADNTARRERQEQVEF
ncbi:MAG: hypothetical protein AAGD32_05370 [Planctomycetota bacterium]